MLDCEATGKRLAFCSVGKVLAFFPCVLFRVLENAACIGRGFMPFAKPFQFDCFDCCC